MNIHGLKKKIEETKDNLRKLKGRKDIYNKINLLQKKIRRLKGEIKEKRFEKTKNKGVKL